MSSDEKYKFTKIYRNKRMSSDILSSISYVKDLNANMLDCINLLVHVEKIGLREARKIVEVDLIWH